MIMREKEVEWARMVNTVQHGNGGGCGGAGENLFFFLPKTHIRSFVRSYTGSIVTSKTTHATHICRLRRRSHSLSGESWRRLGKIFCSAETCFAWMSFVRSEEENLWRNVAREKGLNSSQFRVTSFAYSTLAYLNDIPIRFRLKNDLYLWRNVSGEKGLICLQFYSRQLRVTFCLFNVGLPKWHAYSV